MTIPIIPNIDLNSYIVISIILYVLNRISGITWSSSCVLLRPFGFRLFAISKSKHVVHIAKKLDIKGSHCIGTNKNQAGMFYGKWYVGKVEEDKNGFLTMYLLCKDKLFDNLISGLNEKSDKTDILKEEKKDDVSMVDVKIYERTGAYSRLDYSWRDLTMNTKIAKPKQQQIIDSIIGIYNKKNHVVALISGSPGSGKSITSLILTQKFNCNYCSTFKPTDPGDSFDNLYTYVSPTKSKLLVVLIDEVDIMVDKIHHQLIKQHKDIAIPISDKSSWNRFFDDIDNDLYPFVIFMLTSNKDKSYFDALDTSYMRIGRLDACYELTKED